MDFPLKMQFCYAFEVLSDDRVRFIEGMDK
jgi:hypothetical protein